MVRLLHFCGTVHENQSTARLGYALMTLLFDNSLYCISLQQYYGMTVAPVE